MCSGEENGIFGANIQPSHKGKRDGQIDGRRKASKETVLAKPYP